MLYATAKKVGFDKVIESLICPEGLLWVNYKKRGRYTLSPDELRHAINHVRNNIMMEATQRLAPPYI